MIKCERCKDMVLEINEKKVCKECAEEMYYDMMGDLDEETSECSRCGLMMTRLTESSNGGYHTEC